MIVRKIRIPYGVGSTMHLLKIQRKSDTRQFNVCHLQRVFLLMRVAYKQNMLKTICMLLLLVSLVIAVLLILFAILLPNHEINDSCEPSITSVSGSSVSPVCSGNLIFEENFDRLDKNKWHPEVTISGGSVSEIWFNLCDDNQKVFEKHTTQCSRNNGKYS